jgi:hypothetical protein
MKFFELKTRLIARVVLVCFLVCVGSRVAQAQGTPTSGALLTISGTVGATPVNVTIYDSQIHSGLVQPVPLPSETNTSSCTPTDAKFPTDAFVLQGGSWTGCDAGDAFEVTDDTANNSSGVAHQKAGIADISGFRIETHYVCSGFCSGFPNVAFTAYCNTSGTICTTAGGPDSGFLTVTNNNVSNFTGTITLQGKSNVVGGSWCPANGMAFDTWTTGLVGTSNEGTNSVRLALSPDSSNCGGFNAPQPLTLTAGSPSTFLFGNEAYQITPVNSIAGDQLTLLPVPVPAGPLGSESFTSFPSGQFGSETPLFPTSPFSATNFPTQACIPFSDFSALGNPVCPEIQLTCIPGTEFNDCTTFLYDATLFFSIDANSLPGGVGGVRFLGLQPGIPPNPCPTTGFNFDSLLSYTATKPDPVRVPGNPLGCFAATFDPIVPAVPAGKTISLFVGFLHTETENEDDDPPSKKKLIEIEAGSVVPLIWRQFLNTAAPNTNLHWCQEGPAANPAVCGDTTPFVPTPWVFLSRIPIVCPNGAVDNITMETEIDPNKAGFKNFGNGRYRFNWQTSKTDTGCTAVVLQYDSGLFLVPATYRFTDD